MKDEGNFGYPHLFVHSTGNWTAHLSQQFSYIIDTLLTCNKKTRGITPRVFLFMDSVNYLTKTFLVSITPLA
jgi:hypothetical protein